MEFLPLLGGFVGADTTAVLLGVPEEGVHLAVDLGTNGEIAVGNARDGFLTSSTACGPALEGGNIECGMRGSEGAIDHADITPDGGSFASTSSVRAKRRGSAAPASST